MLIFSNDTLLSNFGGSFVAQYCDGQFRSATLEVTQLPSSLCSCCCCSRSLLHAMALQEQQHNNRSCCWKLLLCSRERKGMQTRARGYMCCNVCVCLCAASPNFSGQIECCDPSRRPAVLFYVNILLLEYATV